jgi:hypothetical protein
LLRLAEPRSGHEFQSLKIAGEPAMLTQMKFLGVFIAYVVIGVILGWGIYLAVAKGNFWVLGVSFLAYVIAFAKIGCLPPSKSH